MRIRTSARASTRSWGQRATARRIPSSSHGRLGSVRRVVDVGGGTGAMLAELLRIRPGVHGTLVDLPRPVARAAETSGRPASPSVRRRAHRASSTRCRRAPIYLLRGVINDSSDREASAILRRCAEAASNGGRVVVFKSVSPDEAPLKGVEIEWVLAGGKSRSLSRFAAIAHEAGLEVSRTSRQPSGSLPRRVSPAIALSWRACQAARCRPFARARRDV